MERETRGNLGKGLSEPEEKPVRSGAGRNYELARS
jgi:hypothetical protein